jgi:beta-glucanase (GH16 family)
MFQHTARVFIALLGLAAVTLLALSAPAHAPGALSTGVPSAPTASPTPTPTGKDTASDGADGDEAPKYSRLKFEDDFDGTSLDLEKWRPNWLGDSDDAITDPVNTREHTCMDPAQVTVADGYLRLKAEKRSCRTTTSKKKYKYASGLVESNHDFRFTYGYVEARMYLEPSRDPAFAPVGSCGPNWPSFWLNGDKWPDDGEIDIMECLEEGNAAWHYHWSSGKVGLDAPGWEAEMPGEGGWHVFAVDWKPNSLTFYYDGKKVGHHTIAVTKSPHYLILSMSLSGSVVRAPQTLKVDYVRVWKNMSRSS